MTEWWHKLTHQAMINYLKGRGFKENTTAFDYINEHSNVECVAQDDNARLLQEIGVSTWREHRKREREKE